MMILLQRLNLWGWCGCKVKYSLFTRRWDAWWFFLIILKTVAILQHIIIILMTIHNFLNLILTLRIFDNYIRYALICVWRIDFGFLSICGKMWQLHRFCFRWIIWWFWFLFSYGCLEMVLLYIYKLLFLLLILL